MSAKYIEIASELRTLITKGLIPLGKRMSERQLASSYNTGRFTIASAFRVLKEEGYLESSSKSGTVVRSGHVGSSVWDKLIHGGRNITDNDSGRSTVRYLLNSEKKGYTVSLHDSFKPNEPVKKAMKSALSKQMLDEYLNTAHYKGFPLLRQELVKHLKRYGIQTEMENIIVFDGYIETLYAIAVALFNMGRNLYCVRDCLIKKHTIVQSTGVNIYEIPIDNEGPLAESFESLIKPGAGILYVNPRNAYLSGLNFSERRMKAIMDVCLQYKIPILENDYMRDFWVEEPPLPLKALNSDYVIYIGCMANGTITGLSTAWAVLPEPVVDRLGDIKRQMTSSNNSLDEMLAYITLIEGYYDEFLEHARRILPERVQRADEILSAHLKGVAQWDPDSLINTVYLGFDETVDMTRIIQENPYYIHVVYNGKRPGIMMNYAGMSIEDFENCIIHCAESIKKRK